MLEINCPDCLSSNILEDRQVDRDIKCTTCGATFLVEKFVEEDPEAQALIDEADYSKILIITGPPNFEYELIDTIIVLDTLEKNFFQNSGPSRAFNGVKKKLRERAHQQGADAIINSHFDYRISAGHGIFGIVHDLEIFAYGTMVKKV